MKHAVLALIGVLVIAFLVVPLVYIMLGKFRSPVDTLASKVHAPLSSQNYIPVPADAADPSEIRNGNESFDLVLEKRCNASGTSMIPSDVTAIYNRKEKRASLTSDLFRFSWNLTGEYDKTKPYGTGSSPYSVLFGGGSEPKNRLVMSIWGGLYNTPECVAYWQKNFGYYNDSGRSLMENKWEANGLQLIEKGITTINTNTYYWYMFEDLRKRGEAVSDAETNGSLLTENKVSNQVFTAIYDTYRNGIKYRVTFSGDKKTNSSYRSILKTANLNLAGLVLR